MQTPNIFERLLNKLNAMSDEQKLKGIAILTGLFLLMVGTLAVVTVMGSDSKESSKNKSNSAVATELEAYKPAATKIGSFPSVGACRVLDRQDIANSLGGDFILKPNQSRESYYHIDAPSNRVSSSLKTEYLAVDNEQTNTPFTSTCLYESADGSGEQTIKIVVKQYPTNELKKANIKNVSTFNSASPEDIKKLQQQLEGQLSATTTKFLNASASTSKEYAEKASDSSVDIAKMLEGKTMLIEPGSEVNSEVAIELYENNVVVSVEIVGGQEKRAFIDIPNKEYAAMLNGISKASAIIHTNFNNQEQLSAPAPTSTVKTVPGSNGLKIVDACTVLTLDSFQSFTGAVENMPVLRTSFPVLTAADATDKVTNITRSSNDCIREYNARNTAFGYQFTSAEKVYGISGYATMKVEVLHAKNSTLAKSYMQSFRTGTKLTVENGEAYRNTINQTLFTARKGQYALSVVVEKYNSNEQSKRGTSKQSTQLPVSDTEMSKLANDLLKNL